MAEMVCKTCGEKPNFWFAVYTDGECSKCRAAAKNFGSDANRTKSAELVEEEKAVIEQIGSILVTTETAPNINITKRLKIIVSSKESSLDLKLATKQEELFYDLKEKCHTLGGNAVVGVSINIVETYAANIGVGEFKKFALIAYGTAVVAEDV